MPGWGLKGSPSTSAPHFEKTSPIQSQGEGSGASDACAAAPRVGYAAASFAGEQQRDEGSGPTLPETSQSCYPRSLVAVRKHTKQTIPRGGRVLRVASASCSVKALAMDKNSSSKKHTRTAVHPKGAAVDTRLGGTRGPHGDAATGALHVEPPGESSTETHCAMSEDGEDNVSLLGELAGEGAYHDFGGLDCLEALGLRVPTPLDPHHRATVMPDSAGISDDAIVQQAIESRPRCESTPILSTRENDDPPQLPTHRKAKSSPQIGVGPLYIPRCNTQPSLMPTPAAKSPTKPLLVSAQPPKGSTSPLAALPVPPQPPKLSPRPTAKKSPQATVQVPNMTARESPRCGKVKRRPDDNDCEEIGKGRRKSIPAPQRDRTPSPPAPVSLVANLRSASVDYSIYYPTFASMFCQAYRNGSPPKPLGEFECMVEQRLLANAWFVSGSEDLEMEDEEVEDDDSTFRSRFGGASVKRPAGSAYKGVQSSLAQYNGRLSVAGAAAAAAQKNPAQALKQCVPLEQWNLEEAMLDAVALQYKVQRSREEVNELVTMVMDTILNAKWHGCTNVWWNLLWTWRKPRFRQRSVLAFQYVNHYPNSVNLTRKDLLNKHVSRYHRLYSKTGVSFHIAPKTYTLPQDYVAFADEFGKSEECDDQNIWILKPVGMSRGRGIEIITELSQATCGTSAVIQQYIKNPYLIDGHKFDFRLYVVVTSFSPVEAFIYKKGFARFATCKYSLDPKGFANKYIHLTNTAVQTSSPNLPNIYLGNGCTKVGIDHLAHKMKQQGIDWEDVWGKITETVLKALVAVEDSIERSDGCFELFGFDVLLDSDYKPWVLEVNASPSLEIDNKLDEDVKIGLMLDIVKMINPIPFDRLELARVLDERLADYHRANSRARNQPTPQDKKRQLNEDLHRILKGRVPRTYGEMPEYMGSFERIAPSANYSRLVKVRK